MPASYTILPHLNLYLVEFRGDITVDQNIETFQAYRADPLFDSGQHLLLDTVGCRFPDNFFVETQRIAQRMAGFNAARDPRARTSIFAPEKVAYGICKLYCDAIRDKVSYQVGVYSDAADALRALDLDLKDPEVRGLLYPGVAGYSFV